MAAPRSDNTATELEEDDYNKLGHHHKEEVPDHMIGEFPPEIASDNKPNLKEDSESDDEDDKNMMVTSFL